MGQLHSLRRCSSPHAAGGGVRVDLLVMLEDPAAAAAAAAAAADPRAQALQATLAALLEESRACLAAVRGYQDQGEGLRAAMAAPQDEGLQLQAFRSLLPNVAVVKAAYDLGARLCEALQALFRFLANQPLRDHPLLLRRLADLLDLCLLWDYEKMRRPGLQNDFSYYRRYYAKVAPRLGGGGGGVALPVGEAEAGLVSMFIAQPLPLTVAVEGAIKGLGGGGGNAAAAAVGAGVAPAAGVGGEGAADAAFCAAVDTVGVLANVACDLALRPGVGEGTRQFALRVMTAAVVLYDRTSLAGVFAKRSPVRTKRCLRTLRRAREQPVQQAQAGPSQASQASQAQLPGGGGCWGEGQGEGGAELARQLLNSVRYSTVHFKDAGTPGYVRSLLSD